MHTLSHSDYMGKFKISLVSRNVNKHRCTGHSSANIVIVDVWYN